jgi:hypothetical protein
MTSLVLFDDWEGDGEITHSSSSKDAAAKIITRLWKLWCTRTQREDGKSAHKDFSKAVRKVVLEGMSEQEIERILEGAARTEPRNRDPHDIRRLTTAITNPKTRKFALAALDENAPIQPNPAHRQMMTMTEVENVLETNREDWGEEDIESAVTLTERYDADTLIEVADKVALIVGQDALFPSEILRHARKVESGVSKVKRNDRRNSYAAGAMESARDEDIDFYADKAADTAFNKGVGINKILAFHNLAPKGYWDEVSNLRRASKMPHNDIYSSLQNKFDWHPDSRESITKGKR